MAQKRMFDKAIVDMDKFMDLPMSGKALYFLLGMEADDEGFVSPRKVLRIHGGNDDDIKILITRNFLIPFESGVVVITDWNKNNWLDSRRIKPTEYKKEKKLLVLTEGKEYVLSKCLASVKPEESSIEENRGEERSTEQGSEEINLLIKSFEALNPTAKKFYANTTQRKACKALIEAYGLERLQKIVAETLPKTNGLQFFPVITTPLQLQDKYVALESAIRKYQSEKLQAKDKYKVI